MFTKINNDVHFITAIVLCFLLGSAKATEVDVDNLSPAAGITISGEPSISYGISMTAVGDFNGDGLDDFMVGARSADVNGSSSGSVYVYFGVAGNPPNTIITADLDGSNGFIINGVDTRDVAGTSVSYVGDVNQDGFDDLLIGAWRADPVANIETGAAYIVFGTDAAMPLNFELSSIDGSNGVVLAGVNDADNFGAAVSGAGDLNNDGFNDILVGAARNNDNGSLAGAAYVVFGRSSFPALIAVDELDGSDGFVIRGVDASNDLGVTVSAVGDMNGDGVDDIAVGAPRADVGGASNGVVYVIFGSDNFTAEVDLNNLINGVQGFQVAGNDSIARLGRSMHSAGDFNGDGADDLLLGSRLATVNGVDAGAAYVIYGRSDGLFPTTLQISTLSVEQGFLLVGEASGDNFAESLNGVGDVNGDGLGDFVVGAHEHDQNGINRTGAAYVIYGNTQQMLAMNVADLTTTQGYKISSNTQLSILGNVVSAAGDFNNDGLPDILATYSPHQIALLFGNDVIFSSGFE